MSRFKPIKFDDESKRKQDILLEEFQELERTVTKLMDESNAVDLSLRKLEESFMWLLKAVKHEQILRQGRRIQ